MVLCLSLCNVFAAITYVVDLAQAQEREEFLRKKYCALLKEKGTIVWTRVMNNVFILCLWICIFV